jgi:hypothetical protein
VSGYQERIQITWSWPHRPEKTFKSFARRKTKEHSKKTDIGWKAMIHEKNLVCWKHNLRKEMKVLEKY